MRIIFVRLFSAALFFSVILPSAEINKRVLICGICRNVAPTVPNTIQNIEALGARFSDYSVIIYENNSCDKTAALLADWARKSRKVNFLSETLDSLELPPTREERIARARNIVLSKARSLDYRKYKYLIMADLDFSGPWPIDEIVASLKRKKKWDCICANGVNRIAPGGAFAYWDRYAFRSKRYPLGPEVIGSAWWIDLHTNKTWFLISKRKWLPVYSAFGGLAIYKTKTILKFSYSGVATSDLASFYRKILRKTSKKNSAVKKYLKLLREKGFLGTKGRPIIFAPNTPCCEHVPLHASMYLRGYNKIYINKKMKLLYCQ